MDQSSGNDDFDGVLSTVCVSDDARSPPGGSAFQARASAIANVRRHYRAANDVLSTLLTTFYSFTN